MPIEFQVDDASVVHARGWGVLTDGDLLEHRRRVTGDARVPRAGKREIVDLREVETLAVSAEGVRAMVAARERFEAGEEGAGGRLAIVATADEVFGVARMYQLSATRIALEIGVFRTLEEARDWLGLLDPPVVP